jgi:hypothetical protein
MSIALNAELTIKVNKETYSEPKCSHGHARGAESLANWLWKNHLGRPTIYTDGAKAKIAINDKTGIIFFKDCFTRAGQTAGQATTSICGTRASPRHTQTRQTSLPRSGFGSFHESRLHALAACSRRRIEQCVLCRNSRSRRSAETSAEGRADPAEA